jgi:lysophospholipase L1-like esterase
VEQVLERGRRRVGCGRRARARRELSRNLARRAPGLCGLLLLATVAAGPAAATPLGVLLVGDSITRGNVSEPIGPAYAELLPGRLGPGHEVTNVAISGMSSVFWAPSTPCGGLCVNGADNLFDDRVTPELPTNVVSLMLGWNDAAGFLLTERTAPDDYESHLREIVDAVFVLGADHMILMTPPIPAVASGVVADLLAGYRAAVLDICLDTIGVVCGPDLQRTMDPINHFAPGDIHPNASGHAFIADALGETMLALPEPTTGLLTSLALLGLAVPTRRRPEPPLSPRRGGAS